MSVLTKVEVMSVKGKFFLAGVTLAVIIGGLTMVYPFILMLAGSTRSSMDASDMGAVPRYMVDMQELAGKFNEAKYNFNAERMNEFRQTDAITFRHAYLPDEEDIDHQAIADYQEFADTLNYPDHWIYMGGTQVHSLITGHLYSEFLERVKERYDGDLAALNRDLGAPLRDWPQLSVIPPEWLRSGFVFESTGPQQEYLAMARELPLVDIAFVNISGHFLERVIYPVASRSDVEEFNQEFQMELDSYREFAVPRRVPDESEPRLREKWLEYVHDHINNSFVRVDVEDERYQEFLREEFNHDLDALLRMWPDAEYESFSEISLPGDNEWIAHFRRRQYSRFLEQQEPEALRLVGPEFAWQDFLEDNYGELANLNTAYQNSYDDWREVKIPLIELESDYIRENSGKLRRRYAGRNFRVVASRVFVQGRAFMNTIIYVGIALFFSLTLQPMVAYSLSRFSPPGMWKIIFFFVATMAFPPMVAMIPRFLMIQHLGLLNTFIALALPVMINGYMIFLLKGFFDSIPQDLYDAALVDGASELHMFRHITLALSYPILAVVALQTFNGAWMSFMYPMIVAPDEDMHVLAVWLQQFQQTAPTPAVFASILIASIPSLIVFIFAQRTIMRGIAVPAEK